MSNKKMPYFEWDVDCLDVDIKGISLCSKDAHGESGTVTLSVTMGVELPILKLIEFLQQKEKFDNHQFWKLRFTQVKKK